MKKEAHAIASWGGNVNVKIPITNTKTGKRHSFDPPPFDEGVSLNITAIMTAEQIETRVAAINPRSRTIVSVFAGRMADTGVDPVPQMTNYARILASNANAELLWASPRELLNLFPLYRRRRAAVISSPQQRTSSANAPGRKGSGRLFARNR